MSKHNKFNREMSQVEEGGQNLAEQEEQSVMLEAPQSAEGAETPQSAEPNEQSTMGIGLGAFEDAPRPAMMGIGQFVRYLLTKSNKSNAEVLELVLKTFEGAKTTAACIAWYKSDLRKKGVLPGGEGRSATKMVEITAEELENMVK